MLRNEIRFIAAAAFALSAGSAFASSDDAWAQFAADVGSKCKEAVKGQIARPHVVVDPTGSEHFGLALVFGPLKGAKTEATFICTYDKQKKTAEIGSELGTEMVRVSLPAKPAAKAK
jgi:hypothetical protein